MELISADGSRVPISRAAASFSDLLDDETATTADAATLTIIASLAQGMADRMLPKSAVQDPVQRLQALSPPQQMAVMRAAKNLGFSIIERLAAIPLTAMLRGRSADVLRVVLNAEDDMTPEEKRQALAEPLLTQPTADDLRRGASACGDSAIDDDDALMAGCLCDLDARSLRTLKAVSRTWRRRARAVLGDSASSWRRAGGEWSAGAWAVTWFSTRLEDADPMMRKRALLSLDALEHAVELPQYVPQLLQMLTPDERSSHRALVLRALHRVEPLTLAPHAQALRVGLQQLEPHEAVTDAATALHAWLSRLGHGSGATEPMLPPVRADADTSAVDMGATNPVRTGASAKRARGSTCALGEDLGADDLRRVLGRRQAATQ